MRPSSIVNQADIGKTATWQLDSSSWEFLGHADDEGKATPKIENISNICQRKQIQNDNQDVENVVCHVLENIVHLEGHATCESTSKYTPNEETSIVGHNTNRSESSSPYDNLFLDQHNDEFESKHGKYFEERDVLRKNEINEVVVF
jgi:hypothetical protein